MPGVKISALPAVVTAQLTDIFPVVQSGVTSKETVAQLASVLNNPSVLTGFLPLSGGTMTGNLILNADPTLPLQAATKEYVDLFASGITIILATYAATTGNLNVIQAGAGIGATLTDNSGTFAAFSTDGVSPPLNSRILVKNQTLSQHNGVYELTTNGDGIAIPYVLTRTTDYDTAVQIKPGTLVAVNNGTVNATTSWLETATVVIVDTDPVLFSQFTFAPSSFLLKANNLSDLTNVPAALVNLGLGVPTGTGNVVRQTSPTLITPILGAATATSLTFNPTTNGIIGTPTNNNAAAGVVGEFVSSVIPAAGAIAIPSVVATNMTSISLTAGDWDVWGNITYVLTGQISAALAWVSSTSATLPDSSLFSGPVVGAMNNNVGSNAPCMRFSLAGVTTIYISGYTIILSGSAKMCGGIYARRVR